MKKYCGIAFMLFSLLFVACKSDSSSGESTAGGDMVNGADETSTSAITKLENEYPAAFSDLSIPLIKGAKIHRADKHNHNTGDKFQITFDSDLSPKEIEEYYLKTMQKKGWKVTNSTKKPRTLNAYFSICNNGENQLVINAVPNESNNKTTASMFLMPIPNKKTE